MANYLGLTDDYLPSSSKPSLQQYDNYQIHSLYCVDVICKKNVNGLITQNNIIFQNFIAVQAFDVNEIEFDFDEIIQLYP